MRTERKRRALVVEGGAMRGIFAAGVLDAFIANNYYEFDFCVGVSAGSTNLVGYLSKQFGRNEKIIKYYATSKEFIDIWRFIKGGHLCDVEWLWYESYYRESKLNDFFMPLWIVTTNVITGKPHYFCMPDDALSHATIIASCAIPIAYRHYPEVDHMPMTDGGISDSIPVEFAYQHGARDITVILSKPFGYRKKTPHFLRLLKSYYKDSPNLYTAIMNRHYNYNRTLDFIMSPPMDCKIKVISPLDCFPVRRLTRSAKKLDFGYQQGLEAGVSYLDKL